MRFSDVVFEIVKKYADTVFFLPGGGAMFLVDALGRSNLNRVSMLHEQGAGYCACGYAQIRDSLGVCLVTSGPGSTNILTPCALAWTDSIPVLFISGTAKTSTLIGDTGLRTRGNQEIDIVSMVKPITKYSKLLLEPDPLVIDESIKQCLSGRKGPSWVNIPLDIQGKVIEW
jgi:acetolactate synthase-1/2/3 large subunit